LKKVLLTLSSGMMALTLITGCGAANNRDLNGNGVRNVGYHTNQGNPNLVPDNDVYRSDINRNNRSYMRNADVNNNGNNNFQWDNQTARRIASQVSKINGVRDASVLISGNRVVVGVIPESTVQNTQSLDEHVRSVAKSLVNDKQVRVVTDRNIVRRMMDVNTRMDNGSGGREIQSDVKGIFNDIGDVIKRPFQNNAR
jgi:YhcN/YlaJ family sporulation lipoprotein